MYQHFFKRLFDFLIGLVALPFVLLAIVLFAPFIYFTDKGPVFYNATRRGMNGKKFTMYKFRSMKVNSPVLHNADGSTYTGDNDPRVTKIGKFMRKFSIDEIPQFLNVLKGDMSIVGPRPTLANAPYEQLSDLRKKALTVRPGITGYSQAYFRNSITQDEKFEKDAYYVDHISLMMDVKILFRTAYSVLAHKNINHADEKKEETPV